MEEIVQPTAAAPAPPAAPAPVETPDFAAFEREETTRDLDRAAGKIAPPKPATVPPAPTGDDAPALDAKGQPVTGPDGKPLSKRQQDTNKRIQDAIERGTAEARERADRLEREIAALKALQTPAQPAKQEPAAPPVEDKEPTLNDFLDQDDPYLAYNRALVKWDLAQARKADAADLEQKQRAQQAQQHVTERFNSYVERETAFKAGVPDFDAKTLPVRQVLDVRSPLTLALLESPVAPQIILHLAEHPDDFARIGAIGVTNPAAALRELGKLEAQYESAAQPAPATPAAKHVTEAPAPGTFLGSQPAPAADSLKGAVARRDFTAYDAEATAKDLALHARR